MTPSLWIILGIFAAMALIVVFNYGAHTDDDDADEAVNSCKAALRECEPTVRRVRAGS